MTGRIHVNITGMSEGEKADALRQMAEAMAGIGFSLVKPPEPPKPVLRVITGGGDRQ